MPRAMSPEFKAAIAAPSVPTALLLAIKYPQGTVRFTDNVFDLEWNGFSYTAIAGLGNVSAVSESEDLEISSLVVELLATQSSIVSTVLAYDHVNRELTLLRACLDGDGQIVGVIPLFDGLTSGGAILDAAPVETGGSGSPIVQIEASSHFGDLDQRAGRFTNSESQNNLFPDDKGFEYATDLVESLIWGRKDNI